MSLMFGGNNRNFCKDVGPVLRRLKFPLSAANPPPERWSELPNDVKVAIFSRLPGKELIQSKLVCREWNFLISSVCIPSLSPPHLSAPFWGVFCFEYPGDLDPAKEYANARSIRNSFISRQLKFRFVGFERFYYEMFMREEENLPTIADQVMSLLPSPDCNPSSILDCCNGLLLLAFKSQYYVGNPTTRQRLAIPVDHPQNIFHSSLVFDPSFSLDFNIVSFIRPVLEATGTDPLALDLFSSKTGRWSSHVISLAPNNLCSFEWLRQSIYFKGALYYMWKVLYLVCIDNVIPNGDMDGSHLKAWAIELPDTSNTISEEHCGCIGHSSCCFYYANRNPEGSFILVWMLVEDGQNHCWNLRHKISITYDVVSNEFPSLVNQYKRLDSFRPRLFHPTDDVIIIAGPRVFLFYHLQSKRVSVAHIPYKYNKSTILLDQNWIFPYSQSLFLLNNIAPDG